MVRKTFKMSGNSNTQQKETKEVFMYCYYVCLHLYQSYFSCIFILSSVFGSCNNQFIFSWNQICQCDGREGKNHWKDKGDTKNWRANRGENCESFGRTADLSIWAERHWPWTADSCTQIHAILNNVDGSWDATRCSSKLQRHFRRPFPCVLVGTVRIYEFLKIWLRVQERNKHLRTRNVHIYNGLQAGAPEGASQ